MEKIALPPPPLSDGALRLAGALALANAFLALPLYLGMQGLEGRTDPAATLAQGGMTAANAVLVVAILVFLRLFLHARHRFRDADGWITVQILGNLGAAALLLAALFHPPLREIGPSAAAVLLIPLGAAQALTGARLLRLRDPLGGMLRPYCWLNIGTGIMLASLILVPAAMITGAVSDLMLGTIFLQAARRAARQLPS